MDKINFDKGFHMIGTKKMVWDSFIYKNELNLISNLDLPEKNKHSLQFAIFRANLYNLKLGCSIDEDFELYANLYRGIQKEEIYENTIFISDTIEVKSTENSLKKEFNRAFEEKHFFVINSFHYASYKMILKYIVAQNCDIYILGTHKSISKNEEKTQFFIQLYNKEYGTSSTVSFIDAEKPDSLLKLSDVVLDSNKSKAKVLLVNADGNMYSQSKTSDNDKYQEKILFHGSEISVRKGVFAFAKIFKLRVFDVVMTMNDLKPVITINNLYDCRLKEEFENIVPSIFKTYEKLISRENIPNWECILNLHHWITKKRPQSEVVSENNYDENRFMIVNHATGESYLFDFKYYLSYKINEEIINKTFDIKQFVLNNQVKA
jgi:hypothetical protein